MLLHSICIKPLHGLFLAILLFLPQCVMAESVESAVMPGKVIEGHAKYEQECEKCHKRFDKDAQNGLCLDCHKETAADVRSQKGYHGRLKEKVCRECHTDHKGRNAKIVVFNKSLFKHDETGFVLEDKHSSAKCEGCHKPKTKYRETPSKCDACHRKDDVHKGKLGTDCGKCHDAKDWKKSSFDHEKSDFRLIGGKHADVACKKCHTNKEYKGAAKECVGCHRKNDQDKGHKGRYGTKCESCHTDKDWKEIRFNHDRDTHFDLRGKHQPVKCDDCHLPSKGDLYKQKLPVTCVSCHRKDDQAKGHQGSLGEKCESCHNDKSWKSSNFDHDKDTKYPLKGKHRDAKCETCHKGGVTGSAARKKLESTCVGCHRKDDQEKGHKGNYGSKCESCHTEKDWKALTFDHTRDTRYILKDKHQQTACKACHPPEKALYGQKLEATCISCHRKVDQEKAHKGDYGSKCESCNTEKDWKKLTFDHTRDTRYILKDKHQQTPCKACHPPGKPLYGQKLETTCISCHRKDDLHKGQLGLKCETCHKETRWQDAPYDHAKARFVLTGSHVKLECKKCHETPAFRDTKSTCAGCHQKDDVHKKQLGPKCDDCHNTRTWKSWNFDHDRRTKYKLDGAHLKTGCLDCHRTPVEKTFNVPLTCAGCHSNKDVHDGGFGQQCERCHVTEDFTKLKPGAAGFTRQ